MAADAPSRGGPGHVGREFPGGTPAPVAGTYESANLFGTRTGQRITVAQGDTLPALPRGFTWVVVNPALGC